MRSQIFIILALLFFSNVAEAQQTQSIEFDRVVFDAANITQTGGGEAIFANQNTTVTSRLREGFLGAANSQRLAGSTLNLNSGYGGEQSISGGFAGVVNGIAHNRLWFSGLLNFSAESIVLPIKYNRSKIVRTVPAALTGNLNIYDQNPALAFANPISSARLNLNGTATVTVQFSHFTDVLDKEGNPTPYFKILRVVYNSSRALQNAEPMLTETAFTAEQN